MSTSDTYLPPEKVAYQDWLNARMPSMAHYIGGCWHGRYLPCGQGAVTAGDPKDGHRYYFTRRGNVMVWVGIDLESRQWAGSQVNEGLSSEDGKTDFQRWSETWPENG